MRAGARSVQRKTVRTDLPPSDRKEDRRRFREWEPAGDILMDKQHIRNRIREERERLSAETVEEKSAAVCRRLMDVPELLEAACVMTYADFKNEIQTGEITGWLLYQGKTVCLPVVSGHALHAVRYRGIEMTENAFGISEPQLASQDMVEPADVSVVLCPGVAFSRNKERLGFGKGYYDRFLEQAPQAFKIGLAYDFQVLAALETGPHDVPMDMIVTPDYVIS